MIHTVKGFSVVDEAEVDVFLESPRFFCDLADVVLWCCLYLWVCSRHCGWLSSICFIPNDWEASERSHPFITVIGFSSVQFSRSVVSDSLWPHDRPPCPSPTPGVHSGVGFWYISGQWHRREASGYILGKVPHLGRRHGRNSSFWLDVLVSGNLKEHFQPPCSQLDKGNSLGSWYHWRCSKNDC